MITDSMPGPTGLLGYPDMLQFGMIPGIFPLAGNHEWVSNVDPWSGEFPDVCQGVEKWEIQQEGEGEKRMVKGKEGLFGRGGQREEGGKPRAFSM